MNRIRGNTTVLTLILVTALAAFVGAALQSTLGVARLARRSRAYNQAIDVGLGAFQLAFADWRSTCRSNWGKALNNTDTTSIATIVSNNMSSVVGNTGATVSNFTFNPVTPQLATVTTATKASGLNPSYFAYYYLATETVTVPALGGSVKVNLAQVFADENQSPWSYAIFYNDDLEINPGANMTVNGSVHTNGNLYSAYSDLTLAGQTTYSSNWNIAFESEDGDHNGVTPASPSYPSNAPPTDSPPSEPFGIDGTSLFASNNPNTSDNWRELIDIPNNSYSDPFSSNTSNTAGLERYYDQAYATILIGSNNSITIMDSAGNIVNSHSSGADLNLYNTMTSAVTTNQWIWDGREGQTVSAVSGEGGANVRLTQLNVGTITTAANNGTLSNFTGVIYIADTSGSNANSSGNAQRGIELINGQSLPNGSNGSVAGLTIASENPVYIQGDYNTGAGTPASDTGTPTSPTVSGYSRMPSLIAADAVTILSNAWSNSRSTNSESSRVATNTTVNAAILAGIVPTGADGDNYSGGAENFPRFLENWGGVTFTYYGSMVELYNSEQANAPWGGSNVYSPPTRQWYFDTNFLSNTPPGALLVSTYTRQRWYQY